MNLEIIKGIKLTGIGIQKVGDKLTMDESSGIHLLSLGFAKQIGNNESPKPTAAEVAELIALCETLEDLKEFDGDDRQVVNAARKKKLKELE